MRKWKGTALCQVPQEIVRCRVIGKGPWEHLYKSERRSCDASAKDAPGSPQEALELRWSFWVVPNQSKWIGPWTPAPFSHSVLTSLRKGAKSQARQVLLAKGYAWSWSQLWVIRSQHSRQLREWLCWPWMEGGGWGWVITDLLELISVLVRSTGFIRLFDSPENRTSKILVGLFQGEAHRRKVLRDIGQLPPVWFSQGCSWYSSILFFPTVPYLHHPWVASL